jgi:dTDP-glucose pyrophosphorylase
MKPLNIVIPMAGRGSRFANAGYADPKPLIPVGGRPMIEWVIGNIRPNQPHRFLFIAQRGHLEAHPAVRSTLERICPGTVFVTTDTVTEGAACTVLLAREHIDSDAPLMIANADQFVALPIDQYLAQITADRLDGLIMTFHSDHPKWSFCRLRPDGLVSEVVEKQVVSNEATVGIYNFRHGSSFVQAADAMIARNLRVNNEFYVAPTYNQLIEAGARVGVARTGHEYDGMYGLGTPEDLDFFKTTTLFHQGRLAASASSSPVELARERTRRLLAFLTQGSQAGLRAMLSEPAAQSLQDPRIRALLLSAEPDSSRWDCQATVGSETAQVFVPVPGALAPAHGMWLLWQGTRLASIQSPTPTP